MRTLLFLSFLLMQSTYAGYNEPTIKVVKSGYTVTVKANNQTDRDFICSGFVNLYLSNGRVVSKHVKIKSYPHGEDSSPVISTSLNGGYTLNAKPSVTCKASY